MAPIFEPTITRIAETTLSRDTLGDVAIRQWMEPQEFHDGETIIEFAGRGCYESFHRPSEKTNTTAKYIDRTVHQQVHTSILEHASVTYYIEGISRALTHELVRHRHFGFSQQSQRFVNVQDSNFIVPPAIISADPSTIMALELAHKATTDIYGALVEQLDDEGKSRKEAREASRAVIPNMIETRITITGNLRSWLEFVNKRDIPTADAEIRRLAAAIHEDLRKYAPTVFSGLTGSEELTQ